MDLSKLVDYEAEFPVSLLHPNTRKPVGVTFWMRSMAAKDIKRIDRLGRNDMLAANKKANAGGDFTVSADALDVAERVERDKLIAAITRWDWGGNEFGELGKDPECNDKNKAYVLDHPASDWFMADLYAGAMSIANFTQK
jgi:hypothetical protein